MRRAYKVEEYLQHHKSRLVGERSGDILEALERLQKEKLDLSRYNYKVILSIAFKTGKLATFDNRLRNQALARRIELLPDKI